MTRILYEINTPVYLNKLTAQYGKPVQLGDIPDSEIANLVSLHVEWVWLMGIWQRSEMSRAIGMKDAGLQALFREVLPDYSDEDFIGSAYAIKEYRIPEEYGGEAGLQSFREKLRAHNIKLMLDFVPNHTAPDHAWVTEHPEYYVQGTPADVTNTPNSYLQVSDKVFANGRDPQYAAWTDVVQLNTFSQGYRDAAIATLRSITQLCDGVRCDMAMLLINDIFAGTWQEHVGTPPSTEFWSEVIGAVKQDDPDFTFLAEAYWDLEEDLLKLGFDYTYDKTTLDLLLAKDEKALAKHLAHTQRYRSQLVTFLENHDEARAASIFDLPAHKSAAKFLYSLNGMWLIHDGQTRGNRTKLPVHLGRGPDETTDNELLHFYNDLIKKQ